jgi:hypothetical protein
MGSGVSRLRKKPQIIEPEPEILGPEPVVEIGEPQQQQIRIEIPSTAKKPPRPLAAAHLQIQLVSPRREEALRQALQHTPQGPDKQKYRYYCPLCMEFFQDILASKCCMNYLCLQCCGDFLKTKKLDISSANDILRSLDKIKLLSCPHCNSMGFQPAMVPHDL